MLAAGDPRRIRPPSGGRRRRLWKLVLLSVGTVLLLLGLGVAGALPFLESDRGRQWIVRLARERGLHVDYDRLVLAPFSGRFSLEGLRIAMPEPHAHVARECLSLGRIDVEWSPQALLAKRLLVRRAAIEGVRAHLVVDDEGRDSLTLVLAPFSTGDSPAEPPRPLSQSLSHLRLPLEVQVDSLALRDVQGTLTERLGSDRERRTTLDGIELKARLSLAAGPRQAELALSSPDRPEGTRLVQTRTESGQSDARELDLRLSYRAMLDADGLNTEGALSLIRQTFDETLSLPKQLASFVASVRFLPEGHKTRVELNQLDLLDGLGHATFALELRDGSAVPDLESGQASLDVSPLPDWLSELLGGALGAQGVRADIRVHPPRASAKGTSLAHLEVHAHLQQVDAALDDASALHLQSAAIEVQADVGEEALTFDGEVRLERAHARAPDASVEAEQILLSVEGREVRIEAGDRFAATGDVGMSLHAHDLKAHVDGVTVEAHDARGTLRSSEWTSLGARAMPFEGRLMLASVRIAPGHNEEIRVDGLRLDVDGHLKDTHRLDARSRWRARSVRVSGNDVRVHMQAPDIRLGVNDASLDTASIAASSAALELDARSARVEAHVAGTQATSEDLELSLAGRYAGRAPSALSGRLRLARAHVASGPGEPQTLPSPAEITFALSDVAIDERAPLRSRGTLHASGRLPPVAFDLDAQLTGGDARGDLDLRVESIPRALAMLGASRVPEPIDLDGAGLTLQARGSWTALTSGAPKLRHHLEASVTGAALRGPGLSVELPRIGVVVDHEGQQLQHAGTVRVDGERVKLNERVLDEAITLTSRVTVDGDRGTANVESTLSGPGGLDLRTAVDATLAVDGTLGHAERFSLARPGVLAAAIPRALRETLGVDFAALSIEGEGAGTLRAGDAVHQTVRATVRGIDYAPEGLQVTVPTVHLELEANERQGTVQAEARLQVPRAELAETRHHFSVRNLETRLRCLSQGPVGEGHLTLDVDGRVQQIDQDVLFAYPMRDVSLSGRLVLKDSDTIDLQRFVVENKRGGTRLELSKHLTSAPPSTRAKSAKAMSGGPQRLALKGKLVQDLARLNLASDKVKARGRLVVPFSVDSGDGSLYRVQATLKLENVDVDLPPAQLSVHGVRASIAVEEAVEWTPESGLTLLPYTDRNAFARVRFQDLQPFLKDSTIEVARLRWKHFEAGPAAGSLRIERNVFSVDKLRIEKDDALISGQLVVDYLPGAERVQFRGNVTGLRTEGSDELLDANASIVFNPSRLELEGRMQIVRVSKKHLLELFDLVDPYREDGSMNSLRRALSYGYPKRVSIGFLQGLMSMQVELGGMIGSFLQVSEIRGVPLGPFMNRHVAPLVAR
jgi:hypothetical protein